MGLLLAIMHQSRDIPGAIATFRRHGGVLRTGQALKAGIHPEALYRLRAEGKLQELCRGLYRLATSKEFSDPDLGLVATKLPDTAVCLISALAFHGITTQIPRLVHLAVPRGSYARHRLNSLPIHIYQFDAATFEKGLEAHKIDGRPLRIFSVARTVVDCFKYRNKLGLDIALEALQLARTRKRTSNRELLEIARALRMERVMGPYVQAIP
jgi:predicted transcriptional regulator of viral defense system